MAFVLVVVMKAEEGSEAEVEALIGELAEASRREPGNEHYLTCRDPEHPGTFLLYEQYRDREAFEAHGASEHFARLAAGRLFGLLASRERTFYESFGGPGAGSQSST
jgi:quinol monooxygenase YgiN